MMKQDFSHALSQKADASLVHQTEFSAFLQATQSIQAQLKEQRAGRKLPLLTLPDTLDDCDAIEAYARTVKQQFTSLVVLGTGGSSLGGQTLVALKQDPFSQASPHVYFVDNVDPHSMTQLITKLNLERTAVLSISKSGTTVETLTQTLILLDHVIKAGGVPSKQFTFVTMPEDNPMRRLAKTHGIAVMDHDPKLGGRFSVLSNVGLLPAAVAGADIRALRKGAKMALDGMEEAARGAALHHAYLRKGCNIAVLMPYCDRLDCFGRWYQQLWAESLGKQGYGSTPVKALGAVDQHSQLQLYLDGPRDKLLTVITLDHAKSGPHVEASLATDKAFDPIRGRQVGDVMEALQRGTVETLIRNHVPLRLMHLTSLDEAALGQLLMHFMLETVMTATLAEVNAFDQPAVEESKVLAREYLLANA